MRRGSTVRRVAASLLTVLVLMALLGPQVATRLTGFSATEQHTSFVFAPPGLFDVPETHARMDGDVANFRLLSPDGAPIVFERDQTGHVTCRIINDSTRAFRNLSLVMSQAWLTDGPSAVVPVSHVAKTLANDSWTTAATISCKEACSLENLVESTRFLRIQPADLAAMDSNDNGAVEQAEFMGSPLTSMHILGTDALGRDVLVRLISGLRMSLLVGLIAALSAAILGTAWGITAAMSGRIVATIMMRIVDVAYGLPFIFIVILFVSLIGPSTVNLLVAIIAVQWLTMARTVRAITAGLLNEPYVTSARVMGCGPLRLAFTHIIPNARRPILTWAALLVPAAIKEEAFLSFLGLGVQTPAVSLGTMIADGIGSISLSPWLVSAPALTIFVLVASITFLADGYGKDA